METINSKPLVSVVIPNYNHAPFLKDRIESVLNQTYQHIEVIILDDCSSDYSKDIIDKYMYNPKVSHIIFNEKNSGSTFKQWHKGFELAKGEYIWIAESDDVAHPDFLSKLLTAIDGDKEVVLAASGITLIDEQGNITGHQSISKSKYTRKYNKGAFIKENMLLGNHLLNASSAIFRRDVLPLISNKYTRLKASGDYMFWIEIANCGKVVEHPGCLDYFRRSSSTVTPRLYATGKAFEEAKEVFYRLRELGYIKGIYRNLIVGFRMYQIRRSKGFQSEEVRLKSLDLWKSESKCPLIDYTVLLSVGIYRKIKRFFRNI